MGNKIDQMRRQREVKFGQPPRAKPAATALVPQPDAVDAKARCSGCGKLRAVHRGVIVTHQKGLGKVCVGSRKAPR